MPAIFLARGHYAPTLLGRVIVHFSVKEIFGEPRCSLSKTFEEAVGLEGILARARRVGRMLYGRCCNNESTNGIV